MIIISVKTLKLKPVVVMDNEHTLHVAQGLHVVS